MVKAAIVVKEGRKPQVVSAMVIPGPTLEDKIRTAKSKAILVQLYKLNSDLWTDELTALANERSAQLG